MWESYESQISRKPITQPRIIIHGGAGNIRPETMPPERYQLFRASLLTIISKSHRFLLNPLPDGSLPTALDSATYAVTLLEDDPLYNAGRGAVFTRDGINELEASIMITNPTRWPKRGVGVSGLRRVKNPIKLAAELLKRGGQDLVGKGVAVEDVEGAEGRLNVPSAQGHTHLHGAAAEQLAEAYGLELVDPSYFWTKDRWEQHRRGLEREKAMAELTCSGLHGCGTPAGTASWSSDEFIPQGTVGAVVVDAYGTVCVATSTGGLTNKLTGRIGDTPTVGAGFWAEEWLEELEGQKAGSSSCPAVVLSGALKGLVADCLSTPRMYQLGSSSPKRVVTKRAIAVSGTGNGDSFLRTTAARTVGAIAQFGKESGAVALTKVTGPGGELQRSAGDRWGKTGEGEGGMIGIECIVVYDGDGNAVESRSEILQDFNCGGMLRAWVDEQGVAFMRVFRKDPALAAKYVGEGIPEDPQNWCGEKL